MRLELLKVRLIQIQKLFESFQVIAKLIWKNIEIKKLQCFVRVESDVKSPRPI